MLKKNTLLAAFVLLSLADAILFSQNIKQSQGLTDSDLYQAENVRHYEIPANYLNNAPVLPAEIDNSEKKFFRPVFSQSGWSCNQAGGIGYTFTYEINRLRDLAADTSINQYPTHFAFNMLNDGIADRGVSFFDTWDILKTLGTPTVEDYGGMAPGGYIFWPSSYELFHSAMKNRIIDYYRITVKNEEGLNYLKHWLHDHFEGSENGGLANYMISSSGVMMDTLPAESPEAGKIIITAYGPYVGHNMTVVGYNDSIRYDINNDGMFTNHLDINEDGIVDLKDWEIGAFKIVNSWGEYFADSGFAYMMYRLAAIPPENGGILNNDFFVIKAKEHVEPLLTMKIGIEHNARGMLKITPGVSTNSAYTLPEHTLELPFFNFHGGDYPMRGDTGQNNNFMEFGLDISPLLSYIISGSETKFYLVVEENDPQNLADGKINYFSVIDYSDGETEYFCDQTDVEINNNRKTVLSITLSPNADQPEIINENLTGFYTGIPYSYQMHAAGGTPPYQWFIQKEYLTEKTNQEFPETEHEILELTNDFTGYAEKEIDFDFPFYGDHFRKFHLYADGYIKFELDQFDWPYVVNKFEIFKLEKTITPLMADLTIQPHLNRNIWYEGNENYALFRWSAAITSQDDSEVNFAVKLFPSGLIEFYYGDMISEINIDYLSGISAGDRLNYENSELPELKLIRDNTKISFIPDNITPNLVISENGKITGVIQESDVDYLMNIGLLDHNNIIATKKYSLPKKEISIIHEFSAGGDEIIEPGEQVSVTSTIKNSSGITYHDVKLNISSENPDIVFTDNYEDIGSINPGQTHTVHNICEFNLSHNAHNKEPLILEAVYTSPIENWDYTIIESVCAPELTIAGYSISDFNNDILEPAEDAKIKISIMNDGKLIAKEIFARLTPQDPSVFVHDDLISYGNIDVFDQVSKEFNLSVSEYAPIGYQPLLLLEIFNSEEQVISEHYITLQVGKIPLLIVDLDKQHHSSPLFDSILSKMPVQYKIIKKFPHNIGNYHSVFLCLGGYFNNYELSEWEGSTLAEFLNNGGYLYMEGQPAWFNDNPTEVIPMFNLTTADTGWYELDSIYGKAGSNYENLIFNYHAHNPFCNFQFLPLEGSETLLYNNNDSTPCVISYDNGNYKTIASSVAYGLLEYTEQISYTDSLLKNFLDFFEIEESTLSVKENHTNEDFELNIFPNPSSKEFKINFHLKERERVVVKIYNMQGKCISTLADNYFNKGLNNLIWDPGKINTPLINRGIYICTIQTRQKTESMKLIYIY